MKFAVAIAFIGAIACALALPNVVNFEIKKEEAFLESVEQDVEKDVLSLFRSPAERAQKKPVTLQAFSWKDCSQPTAMAKIKNLDLSPDPIHTPGPLFVTLEAIVKADIDGDLIGNVTIEKKVGETYVKLPCVSTFGSCVYDDLCSLLESVNCPGPVVDAGFDCRCPIKQKTYSLNKVEFDILASILFGGTYRVTGNVTFKNKKPVACLQIIFDASV